MGTPNWDSSIVLPGFYGFVDYGAQGSGSGANNRVLLLGYIGSTAQRTPNQPFLPADQQDADDSCERGAQLAGEYAAALSQPESSGAEVWLMPIAASSGNVASVYKITVYVASTNPGKSGTIQLWANSQALPPVGFTTADTNATIATAVCAAFNTMSDLQIGTATVSGAVVTIPIRHKGADGEDFPMRCNVSPASTGVSVSPGQIAITTAATGAGSIKVLFGSRSVSTAIANSDTAAAQATKVVASFAADTYALTAAVDGSSSSQVNLFFANDQDVRRIIASVITTTGTTVNLGSGATDGTGSTSSLTYSGTLGTGGPSLSGALTNELATAGFRTWAMPWTDSTTVGAVATQLQAEADGSISGQKPQTLQLGSALASSVAGAIATGSSPNLTAVEPRYSIAWSPDAPVIAAEIAARLAAARSAKWQSEPAKNWNAFQVKGNVRSPILLPSSRPTDLSLNTALRTYAVAPVVTGQSGFLEVIKGRTTSLASDHRLWAWSGESQAAFHLTDLKQFLRSKLEGGNIVRFSEPKAPRTFDDKSVTKLVQSRMRKWEADGNYDGADVMAPFVKTVPSQLNVFFFRVDYPESPLVELDGVMMVGHFSSPSQ